MVRLLLMVLLFFGGMYILRSGKNFIEGSNHGLPLYQKPDAKIVCMGNNHMSSGLTIHIRMIEYLWMANRCMYSTIIIGASGLINEIKSHSYIVLLQPKMCG